jgi:hypothetical protein
MLIPSDATKNQPRLETIDGQMRFEADVSAWDGWSKRYPSGRSQTDLRVQPNFVNRINAILAVQSSRKK